MHSEKICSFHFHLVALNALNAKIQKLFLGSGTKAFEEYLIENDSIENVDNTKQ